MIIHIDLELYVSWTSIVEEHSYIDRVDSLRRRWFIDQKITWIPALRV